MEEKKLFMQTAAIGIDLGATKIAAALVTGDGQVLAARQAPTAPLDGPAAVLDRIAALANELCAEAAAYPHNLLGIGLGSPGRVDALAGVVYNAVNLGWQSVPVVAELRSRLARPLPVWIQKDVNTSAVGEYVFGAAKDCPDFLFLSIGTGLGGGLMAGGRLITGANWNATELGHISFDPLDGRECVCGLRGCAETLVSGPGLAALFKRLRTESAARTALAEENPESGAILQAARAGDDLARLALIEMGRSLGQVIAFCAAVTNPSLVVIGGGLGLAAFDLILPSARMELQARVLKASHIDLRILPSRQPSSAVGAASLAWYFSEKEVMSAKHNA